MSKKYDLSVNIGGGITLANPVMTGSGTFGYAKEFAELIDLKRLGGIIVKGLSLEPSMGNPPPRITETPCGILNAIGLENVGFDVFVKEKLPFLQTLNTPVFVNIYGKTIEEYAQLALKIQDLEGIAGIEVNISCPNVKAGGVAFGTDPLLAYQAVLAVRKNTSMPLIVKLSPNVTDITKIASSVVDAGADCLSLINTITGMAIDIKTRKSKLANITGGLSGPAIRPIALRMVWQTAQAVSVPIIGVGGIMSAEHALEFIIAGASAVQIGTANFITPCCTMEIIDGIEQYMADNNINTVSEIIGTIQT
ncbi:Dihydroorotate dehydrogenase B (NAD(+)), catalytic subunit [Desulfonema limicola]|uniref:Dihydroorotate dehydrogenase n=1 Tax=Desulfonema limicola TaxID=45656 RepID=A0A975BBB9_9BACT|nr:dihydroorotate dehydrogenase [Desulfonema limicola]QTA82142.1 Dihydroorotate dehydrogenase B (NAD(+)), catalytic subunit [Desulfonema limicola]